MAKSMSQSFQSAVLRWIVRVCAFLSAAVIAGIVCYVLYMGVPNLSPEMFAGNIQVTTLLCFRR